MTVQEAIEYLQLALEESDFTEEDGSISELYKEMCKTAIKELEKQIPKKPKNIIIKPRLHKGECPICSRKMIGGTIYCSKCGQKLDWEEGGTSD